MSTQSTRSVIFVRLRILASFAMMGATIAGALGHHGDDVQWAATVAGMMVGGLLVP